MKNISIILLTVAIAFTSCKFEEKDLFSSSAADRLTKSQKEYTEVLCSASNGWVMDYFPHVDSEYSISYPWVDVSGRTFLVKFLPSGKVELAAKNSETANQFVRDICTFELIADNGPVLSFNSYGETGIFHLYSSPADIASTSGDRQDETGVGYNGDYEFMVISATPEKVILKGKKRGVYIDLRRLPEDQNWVDYFTKLDAQDVALFKNNPLITLVMGDSIFDLYNAGTHTFKAVPKGGDYILDAVNLPFIVTDFGLRLSKVLKINGVEAHDFELSADKQKLVATTSPNAYMTAGNNVYDAFVGQQQNNNVKWVIDLTDANMGTSLSAVLNSVKSQLAAVGGVNLSQVDFRYAGGQNALSITLAGIGTPGLYYYTVANTASDVVYTSKNQSSSNGTIFANNASSISDLVSLLSTTYTLVPDNGINYTKIKVTATNDANLWFYVVKK
ncbi:MAG: DUF4302 domain-containing protein [Prevotellaceae bacterium]|jgi:hypothetical protein|nr:DUF4302 domain-containing protein [Prevotellaceae bacterium]